MDWQNPKITKNKVQTTGPNPTGHNRTSHNHINKTVNMTMHLHQN